jgi:hypothetical protein
MTGGSIAAKEFVLIDYLQWIELLSSLEMPSSIKTVFAVLIAWAVMPLAATRPSYVDITWMSIANMYYEIGNVGILTDGYFTRIPQDAFYGGGGGLAHTRMTYKPDVDAVSRVLESLGGKQRINLLLTGHSHWDHSFDTATWSRLTGARIIGSKTTCFQAIAERVPADRCRAVYGGEKIDVADGVTMRVIRWNHSGDTATNPEQHDPVELESVPHLDATTGGLHAGVAEDFPNGGGARAFLFTVDGAQGRFSWLFQDSASAADLQMPIVIAGKNYGAPLDNLKAAMKNAGLDSVDLWIGTGGQSVAKLVLPVLHPKAYMPVHWDGLYGVFQKGVPRPYADAPLEDLLRLSGVNLIKPAQYMDKWRLDRSGLRSVENVAVQRALGFH